MLEKFKDSQFVAYSLLVNAIRSNKLSHAYLIDTNHYEESFDFVLSFVKSIVCKNHYTNDNLCDICNLCQRIQNNNYPELKIIETDSNVIKKEQLLELQSDFSRSSLEGDYRIYIIRDCDKMNKQASNCLLKFLEEPVDGVIAILLTNNFSKILSTIVSRCQVIRLNNVMALSDKSTLENFALVSCDNKILFSQFIEDETKLELINSVISFLDYFEENTLDVLLYMKNLWYNNFQTREDTRLALMLIVYFYYDLLKYKIGNSEYFFCDKIDFIKKCANMNSIDSILKKIDIVSYGYEMVGYNLNINLLLDDILIRLGDLYEYS